MKKITLLFVSALALGLTFASCNKDDDNSSSTPSLEGKWVFAKEGMVMNGVETLNDYQSDCATKHDFMELKSGGVAKEAFYPSDCTTAETTLGTWTKSGNNVIVTYEGEAPMTAQVVTLDATTLKVKFTEDGMTYVVVFSRA